MSWVEPSLYVAVAVNCCVLPATMVGVAGATVMLCSVAVVMVTLKVTCTEPCDAVMVAVPGTPPCNTPLLLTFATRTLELL